MALWEIHRGKWGYDGESIEGMGNILGNPKRRCVYTGETIEDGGKYWGIHRGRGDTLTVWDGYIEESIEVLRIYWGMNRKYGNTLGNP